MKDVVGAVLHLCSCRDMDVSNILSGGQGVAQVLECLYSMHKALDSILEPNMVEFICILVLRR